MILRSMWNPAKEIQQTGLELLSVEAAAVIAALRVEKGRFRFVDQIQTRLAETQKLVDELTVHDGVYPLSEIISESWSRVSFGGPGVADTLWEGFALPAGISPTEKQQR